MNALFKKYNVPGPRYTSYPTVPYWTDGPTEAEWLSGIRKQLKESSARGVGAALYVHIPFCESLCTYCGCNTRITRNHAVAQLYIDTLLREWSLYLKAIEDDIRVSELHLGGGTPTFLSVEELKRLIAGLFERVSRTSDSEFSVEADPRVTTREQLEALASLGFRRLSLGIQDFDPKVQETVHRVQSEEQVHVVTEAARAAGFSSVNFDLIYGLPFQTLKSVENTLEAVKKLRPDRIAFYGYAHVPWIKPGQRRFTEADLPSGEEKRLLYELGRAMLEEVGYSEIGMDHFALETDSLWKAKRSGELHRNFMGYTARQVSPLIGLGVSAIGDSGLAFAQNEKLLETYQSRVDSGELPITRGHVLDSEDRVLRRHVLNLMCRFETSWSDAENYTPFLDLVTARLEELRKDGLLEVEERAVRVLPKGHPFIRNICMAFDARLARQAPKAELFSRVI